MYRFKDKLDYRAFFKFPRDIITSKTWATWPPAAHAVYPVYGVFMNSKNGLSFPSELTVAACSGLAPKTARAGRNALDGAVPGLNMERYVTARGRRSWRLHFQHTPSGRGTFKPFFASIIHGGNWAECKPSAHVLYPVMLNFSQYDYDEAVHAENDTGEAGAFGEHGFDICEAELSVLVEYSGLTRNGVLNGLESLERSFLIERSDCAWKVYRRPPKRYKAEYMNEELQKRGM